MATTFRSFASAKSPNNPTVLELYQSSLGGGGVDVSLGCRRLLVVRLWAGKARIIAGNCKSLVASWLVLISSAKITDDG